MEIEQRRDQDVAFVALTGEFDAASLPAVSSAVSGAIEEGFSRVVLNVREIAILTSSAVGYLLKASKHLKADGGRLVISEPPAWFTRTIDTLGVMQLLELVPSDEAARAALSEDPSA